MKRLAIFSIVLFLSGCAVELTHEGEQVRLVSEQQRQGCKRVKLVTYHQRAGTDKSGNAMKGALNEAAAAGANSFFLVSASGGWADGASVIGEALRCE